MGGKLLRPVGLSTLAGALALAGGCAGGAPVVLSSTFEPPFGASWTYTPRKGEQVAPCRVVIAEVRDTRDDPESMGEVGGRYIRAQDPRAWVQSAFASLGSDKRLEVVQGAAPAAGDVSLSVDLIKAYMQSVSVSKNANVVVRVRYARDGASLGEKTFRGDTAEMNWASADGEAQGALNQALKEVIYQVDQDVLARCKLPQPAAPAAEPVAAAAAAQ